ncbi:MAG: hypothetical protein J5798_06580 [Spirochaetaceae bacterium]|nr:hypothetical protein [Spirochaetaceae bacterium]
MEKIIALYGPRNMGKTTTLKKLIDLLSVIAKNYEISFYKEVWAYFKINGKKIVVCTPGDNKDIVKGNINYTKSYDCDIFVTAARTRGGSVDELKKFTNKKEAELIWVQKEDDESKNNCIAAGLFSLIVKDVIPDFDNFVSAEEENS